MKLGSSRGMDTKRPRGSERSKPCHELQLTRRSQPPYPWPPEQAQPGVSKPCRTTAAAFGATLDHLPPALGRRRSLSWSVLGNDRRADIKTDVARVRRGSASSRPPPSRGLPLKKRQKTAATGSAPVARLAFECPTSGLPLLPTLVLEGNLELHAVGFDLAVLDHNIVLDDLGHPQVLRLLGGALNRSLRRVLQDYCSCRSARPPCRRFRPS